MRPRFEKECEGIYRLRIPFETVYTSVFLVKTDRGAFLVDAATTDADVNGIILPALDEMGYTLSDVRGLVLTHRHNDHAGGSRRLLSLRPDLEVIADERTLADGVRTYPLPGHTEDSIGIFDGRTGTLLSGDGLQGEGVDRFRCSLKNREAYVETVKKLKSDESVKNILFSHAYEPWYDDRAFGREEVLRRLEDCLRVIGEA